MDGTLEDYRLSPIPDYGDHMTMAEWKDCVDCGGFIDYDGFGYLATDTEESDIYIKPSYVENKTLDMSGWSHVVWYNR